MTWVKGQTTWSSLVDKLTKLACGEVADDSSVTVAVGDQWVREIGGQDLLRSHASENVSVPNMSNRSGYWALAWGNYSFANTAAQKAVCKQNNVFTSTPTGVVSGRWWIRLTVTQANTVAGNYSNLIFSYFGQDADTGATLTSWNNSGAVPNSAGVYTLPNGCVVQFSHPDGIIPYGVVWLRGFTTTYTGGIDYWPMLNRKAAAPSFSVAPAGVAGTDYDVVEIPTGYSQLWANNSTAGPAYNMHMHQGLGFKTNGGLTGGLYTVNWTMAGQKLRLYAGSGAENGRVYLEIGSGGAVDSVYQGPVYRQYGDGFNYKKMPWNALAGNNQNPAGYGPNGTPWLYPFITPGSVSGGAPVQYWMSVKPNRIAIVLNGDPGYSGKMTCNWVGKMTPYYPSYDTFPWVWGQHATSPMPGMGMHTQWTLVGSKLRADGSEGRDWQTGWMRSDLSWLTYAGGVANNPFMNNGFPLWPVNAFSQDPANNNARYWAPMDQTKPSTWDNKWWLYGFVMTDHGHSIDGSMAWNAAHDDRFPRGKIASGCLYLPGHSSGGWASGDELTDTVTGDKYFLVEADYHSIWSRLQVTTNSYRGGAAIKED